MDEYLEFAISIAKYAGKEITDKFSSIENIQFKDDRTPVTEVDKRIFLSGLTSKFCGSAPEFILLSFETFFSDVFL